MITNNNNVIYAVVNFDLPNNRIEIGTTVRDKQHPEPFLQLLLEFDDKNIIYEKLKYLYYSIPNLTESYYRYISKMLLGELILAKTEKIWDRYIFKHETGVSGEIASFGLLNSGKNELVLLNVIRSDSRGKKINIDEIIEKDKEANVKLNMDASIQSSRNLKIKEVNLLLKREKADVGEFENWCRKVQVNSYSSLNDYNEKKTQDFNGEFVKLNVDTNKLNGILNKAIGKKVDGAQLDNAEHYIELFKIISNTLFPFKDLINKEADFQAMLHGLLMYHQESIGSKKLVDVVSEVQTGGGKRVDIGVTGGEVFTGIELKFSETKGRAPNVNELTKKAQEAEDQLERYKKQPNNIKSLIDSEGARLFWAVFHKGANTPESLIETRDKFDVFQVIHSSINLIPRIQARSIVKREDNYQKIPLILAVKEDYQQEVESLLDGDAGIEAIKAKDSYGWTASHYAAKCVRLDIVNLLYQKSSDFKNKSNSGKTPIGLINLSLKGSGKDVSNNDKNWLKSWKPLHYAAYNDNVNMVQKIFELLLKESNNDINIKDEQYGYAPLHVAAYYNRVEIAEFLLNKGADIRAKENYGQTPLCIAAQYDKLDMINFLLDKGAKIEVDDFNNDTLPKLAYCIKKIMEVSNPEQKRNFEELKEKLPESMQNIVFLSEVCVKDAHLNQYLYASLDTNSLGYSGQRKAVYTWIPKIEKWVPGGKNDKQGLWKFEVCDDYFCIKDARLNEYLYASSDQNSLSYSGQRKAVYTWIPKIEKWVPGGKNDKQGLWKFEVCGDYFCIKDARLNEYLYAGSDQDSLSCYGQKMAVYTWVPKSYRWVPGGRNSKQGLWKIENCESTVKIDNYKMAPLHYTLDYNANINTTLGSDKKLLTVIVSGDFNEVESCIRQGANIEVQDDLGRTPILLAAQLEKWDMVKLLIKKGAKLNNETTYQGTPLHSAIQEGNLEMVQFLLNQGASVESENDSNSKPLHLAVKAGKLDVIGLLLGRNANVDATDMYSQTPLHLAVEVGRLDVVKLLLNRGASVDVIDIYGQTPLNLATKRNSTDVARYLEQARLNKGLLIAAGKGDLDKVKNSIRQDANVNTQDKKGWSPIFWAIQKNNLNIVKLLVNYGADIKIKDNEGWTPLHWAVQLDLSDVVKYLIEKGADVRALTVDDRTPLDLALQGNCANIVEILQQAKLDLEKGKPTQRKLLSIDSSNQHEITASSGARPSSLINNLCGWAKEKGGKLASSLVNGLYGDTAKELKDSKPADVQIDPSNQLKSKYPSYDQAQEMEFQYMSKYDARKCNNKNISTYSKKHSNGNHERQQYEDKINRKQSITNKSSDQSGVINSKKQQKSEIFHSRLKPTLSRHSDKKHSHFDGQSKRISERKECMVNHKQNNISYKLNNQYKPMIDTNNRWSKRINNERVDSRKMIGNINQNQYQYNSHSSKNVPLTQVTAQTDIPSTLLALNMLAMKKTSQKFNNQILPKKVQKGILYAEKVRAEVSGAKVGGRIGGALYFEGK